jgi:hypothetical protein
MQKKTTKRSKAKYPNLEPRLNSRVRQELIEVDYLHKLNEDELEWLNKFNGEYVNASFNRDGSDIDSSDAGRKASYDRNNARNRDLYGLIKSRVALTKLVNYDESLPLVELEQSKYTSPDSVETAYLDYIDVLEIKVMMREYADAMSKHSEDFE